MKDIIIGMAVGDALGVPFEFIARSDMKMKPCKGMVGYGAHGQPVGTWSDDTSMALCIIDSLCNGLNYTDMANKFYSWLYQSLWTPYGEVFDNGISTKIAINRWKTGKYIPSECGGITEDSNGNGSVMRTLVLVPFLEDKNIYKRYEVISKVSSITHAHWISKFSCLLVCEYALALRKGLDKDDAFTAAVESLVIIKEFEKEYGDDVTDENYQKVFGNLISKIENDSVENEDFRGSGYARDTALTSIWCIMTTDSYKNSTIKAVNYGEDTDTTACVTGGLAGVLYGIGGIPTDWVDCIARKGDILELVEKYQSVYEVV